MAAIPAKIYQFATHTTLRLFAPFGGHFGAVQLTIIET
jgi:hypothetical protein